jgi:K+ transporter
MIMTPMETPRVADEDRVVVTPIGAGITRVELRFGFMEEPNVPKGLEIAIARGQIAEFDLARITYYTGHETIIASDRRPGMAHWREESSRSCTITRSDLAHISRFRVRKSWKLASSSRFGR